MPTDACEFFYRCAGCGEMLRPLEGDCCVFCSYADVGCPPCQVESALKQELVRLAFNHLLDHGEPISPDALAEVVATSGAAVEEVLIALDRRGRMRLNERGEVIASYGISLNPTQHEIHLVGERRYTWCAYETIGILAALRADGSIR